MEVLVVNTIDSRLDRLQTLLEHIQTMQIGAIFVLGNLGAARQRQLASRLPLQPPQVQATPALTDQQLYLRALNVLGSWGVPVFLIPGEHDRSVATLSQAIQMYHGAATLHLVHRAAAPLDVADVVAGFGGLLTTTEEADESLLQFPAWEARVAFAHLSAYNTLFQHAARRIFLFATPPIGACVDLQNGTHAGVHLLNLVIRIHQPHLVCCGGPSRGRGVELIGGTPVVNPGSLADGSYALVDLDRRDVRLLQLPELIPTSPALFPSMIVALDGSAGS